MSKFEYACFISYRNGREAEDRLNTFTRVLADEIIKSVEAFLPDNSIQENSGKFVFLDKDVFQDFDFDPKVLGAGLCKSICWVVIYTRNYFSGSLWCASEYHGMLQIESERLTNLGLEKNPDFGFVAPILLTGDPEEMPANLRSRSRHFFDFRRLFLRKSFENDDDFTDKLTDMLDKIGRVHKVILTKKVELCGSCEGFSLVDVRTEQGRQEIAAFVEKINKPPQPTA